MKFPTFVFISFLFFAIVESDNDEDSNEPCESKFCEEDPNYPERILNTLELWRFNIDSRTDLRVKRSVDRTPFLSEKKLCESQISFMRPQKLKNVNGQFRTIVNHLNYTQIVKFESCSSENFPCTFNVFPQSVQSFCQQKYSSLKLLAFDEGENCIVTEKFLIPTSCDCLIDSVETLKGVRKDLL